MMEFSHTRFQHPVGQGFFHSADLRVNRHRISYVYDCGSESRLPLEREVARYIEGNAATAGLDILFLSHLDADHVSGLDRLLSGLGTNTVILPYLQPVERLAAVTQVLIAGQLDGSYLQLATNPVRWFSDRGVTAIIFVDGDDDVDGGAIELPGEVNSFDANFEGHLGIHPHFMPGNAIAGAEFLDGNGGTSQVFRMSHKSPLALGAPGWLMNWVFATHVYPAKDKVAEFRSAVAGQFPNAPISDTASVAGFSAWLQQTVQNRDSRNALKDCYSVIAREHNLTSMSLYSGPITMLPVPPRPRRVFRYEMYEGHTRRKIAWNHWTDNRCAWVGTGDANLKTNRRRDAFRNHFGQLLQNVLTMTLPHHGSRRNFHPELLQWGRYYLATADLDSHYGHPHEGVCESVREARRSLFEVSESPSSGIREDIRGPRP